MLLQEEIRLLMSLPVFAGVDLSRLRLLAFASARCGYQAGEAIFAEGEDGDGALVIMSGEVSIHKSASGLVHRKCATENSVAIIGQSSMLDDSPRKATAIAETDVEVLRINRACFFSLMKACPRSSERMKRAVSLLIATEDPVLQPVQ